jgi:lipoic acid synthetase
MSERIPPWLIPPVPKKRHLQKLGRELAEMGVHTVCQSAKCPNLGECFSRRTATFMLMGEVCTRDCRFCAVAHGRPRPLDPGEPERVAKAAKRLELRYVVVTSVTRDDLSDGGAGHFARTVTTLRDFLPGSRVEVLVPDFRGRAECVERVVEAGPDVFGHNVETTPRLYHSIRPQADYRRSLEVLRRAGRGSPPTVTKSGFMLGLGESRSEVLSLLADLREAGVRAVTIGQYLPPSREHARVVEYVPPQVFAEYGQSAREMGFAHVSSGPLVRSSYRAEELAERLDPG